MDSIISSNIFVFQTFSTAAGKMGFLRELSQKPAQLNQLLAKINLYHLKILVKEALQYHEQSLTRLLVRAISPSRQLALYPQLDPSEKAQFLKLLTPKQNRTLIASLPSPEIATAAENPL